mmetsp:Transcript_29231/g.67095  ORF Transcript_29231/g.67095 Transcript_29231/m.67095 type:complete len:202 (+) Transcript_29231:649-1254(+)
MNRCLLSISFLQKGSDEICTKVRLPGIFFRLRTDVFARVRPVVTAHRHVDIHTIDRFIFDDGHPGLSHKFDGGGRPETTDPALKTAQDRKDLVADSPGGPHDVYNGRGVGEGRVETGRRKGRGGHIDLEGRAFGEGGVVAVVVVRIGTVVAAVHGSFCLCQIYDTVCTFVIHIDAFFLWDGIRGYDNWTWNEDGFVHIFIV